ncbi:MAG: DNA/RNA nuclease SfsA [Anaerolineae bacterium]|nr:DNA/RNA nuclease SfsA [Anaerolineae bacterium]
MKLPSLVPGFFIRRENRFRARVLVRGRESTAHVPNSGRLRELFTPMAPLWLAPKSSPTRKTPYDLLLVQHGNVLVSVDARLPNALFEEALRLGRASLGPGRWEISREVRQGKSRLDFCLRRGKETCWVEVKSVTLVQGGTALFPDAPTLRGSRHLEELIHLLDSGERAAIVFVVQRPDALRFCPHAQADPLFARTLAQAAQAGVKVKAYICQVSTEEITITQEIPALAAC